MHQGHDHVLVLSHHAEDKGETEKTPHVALQLVRYKTLAIGQIAVILCHRPQLSGGVYRLGLNLVCEVKETFFRGSTLVAFRIGGLGTDSSRLYKGMSRGLGKSESDLDHVILFHLYHFVPYEGLETPSFNMF